MLAATGEPFISILPLVITVGVIVVQIYLVVMLIRAAHDIPGDPESADGLVQGVLRLPL